LENTQEHFCSEEYIAHKIYSTLARNPLLPRSYRDIFKKTSREEYEHYLFWKQHSKNCVVKNLWIKTLLYNVLALLFGVTFVLKLLERSESKAISEYSNIGESARIPLSDLKTIIEEELIHENTFMSSISESRVKYLGSIALGISDALVELTGIYAGSLGAFANPLVSGLTGLLAGLSASISMTIASYMQAKSSHLEKPQIAALFTGLAYVTVTLLLSLPYFLLTSLLGAFTSMILIAVAISIYMAIYTAVLGEKSFKREIIETTGLLLGVSALLYIIGRLLGFHLAL
jgi:VIT1/CCC1 family predicted Fe2+/Mn2+ transporter